LPCQLLYKISPKSLRLWDFQDRAIECLQTNFTMTDPHCLGNEI